MFDKKKIAGIITSKLETPEQHSEPMTAEASFGEDDVGLQAAAEDMMSAFHNKSPIDLHKALQSYLTLHEQAEDDEDAPDEE